VNETLIDDALCEVRHMHPEAIAQARQTIPESSLIENASALLKAVADPTRLRILCALEQVELCVCDIAASVNLSESAVSHQLRLLRETRLVAHRKEGRVVYYRLNDSHVQELIKSALDHANEP
jgi:ArsR family transcriptional regulator, lead/cadmium/zinc/bismuth-responsive transcriptional repressor